MTRRPSRITRTADALHDLRPLDELTREEWAREFRQCLAFAFVAVVLMGAAQFFWS